jgi:hypothetical protein
MTNSSAQTMLELRGALRRVRAGSIDAEADIFEMFRAASVPSAVREAAIEECARLADYVASDADRQAAHLSYGELYGMQSRSDAANEVASDIRALSTPEGAVSAAAPAGGQADGAAGEPVASVPAAVPDRAFLALANSIELVKPYAAKSPDGAEWDRYSINLSEIDWKRVITSLRAYSVSSTDDNQS